MALRMMRKKAVPVTSTERASVYSGRRLPIKEPVSRSLTKMPQSH
jgi:hypothetical protein